MYALATVLMVLAIATVLLRCYARQLMKARQDWGYVFLRDLSLLSIVFRAVRHPVVGAHKLE